MSSGRDFAANVWRRMRLRVVFMLIAAYEVMKTRDKIICLTKRSSAYKGISFVDMGIACSKPSSCNAGFSESTSCEHLMSL